MHTRLIYSAALIIASVAAFSNAKKTTLQKYEIVGEGRDSRGDYWTLGGDVTNNIPEMPGTYYCEYSDSQCTVDLSEYDIYYVYVGYSATWQRRLSKSNALNISEGSYAAIP